MVAEKIINFIENWAPPGAAWAKDNVGLQVGSAKMEITNIFLCLELTERALNEAISKNCNFIFTHHPFIFKPLNKINTHSDPKGKLIEKLIKNNITLYSAHTNLDFTKEGVSFELAEVLKLQNPQFLVNEKSNQFKLVSFIPKNSVDKVTDELFKAGCGIIGNYEKCSFRINGTGTFKGLENTKPIIGKKQNFETVEEVRVEVLIDAWNLSNAVSVLRKSHPYEEPAFDIYSIENDNVNYGYGVIGHLNKSMTKNEFLSHVCSSLKIDNLRYSKGSGRKIKTVAVCGGSGSDLLQAAINQNVDAFVTADLKYHVFQDGENKILFIDAGHYETEIPVLNVVKRKLEDFIKIYGISVNIIKYSGSTNPIKFFNNKRS